MVKYPGIQVQLQDGNALAILGAVRNALRRGDVPQADIEQFTKEAISGDYDNLLAVCGEWVDVGSEEEQR